MKNFTKFSIRFGIYFIVFLYLVLDLYVIDGPLYRKIQNSLPKSTESLAKAKADGVVARVFNHKITRSQLNFALQERLWLEGKKIEQISASDKKWLTYAALGDLIDHQLLRVKTKVNTMELPVSDGEIDERFQRFLKNFNSPKDLHNALKTMGIPDEKSLKNRIAAHIQQEKYVAMRVGPLVKVTEEEIENFYQTHKEALAWPERIRAQHIFIATLDRTSAEAESRLEQALIDLNSGKKNFTTLAEELSEDPATNKQAGDLGWMSKQRISAEYGDAFFSLKKNQAALISTKIGWHLVNITDQKPSEIRPLEEVRKEITNALLIQKRQQAVIDFRAGLRRFENHKIEIFHDQLSL